MLASLQARNPEVVQGGDVLVRQLLFWGAFLPLGACYSIDSATDPPPAHRRPPFFVSGGSIAFLAQLVMVYWFAAGFKYSDTWWHGQAVRRALMIDIYVTPVGSLLLQ